MSDAMHSDEISQRFGEWIKLQRRRLGWTQQELAACCFCSLSTIRKIEAGVLAPSRTLAEQMAAALQVEAGRWPLFLEFARGVSLHFLSQQHQENPQPTLALDLVNVHLHTAAPHYHLPTPLTAFIGRERELQRGCDLLRQPHVRLVTLIGPPGAGKTRLSLALASAIGKEFTDGACFVSLEPLTDPDLVLSAIAHSLGVHEVAGSPLVQSLYAFLRHKQLLLVLDNFEQVIDAAPALAELLTAAAEVKALVSSREALKLYGEYEFPVPPLAVPDINHLAAPELLQMFPAVELFVKRAQAVRADFAIDATNAAAVAQICVWLDGLPLAIEMAASQVKWQPPELLLEQLRDRLMGLTGGPRNFTPRQQTLRGAIDWSFNLLGNVERRLFVALSIFRAGCTEREAAALIDMETAQCVALLRSLVEKSLLYYEPGLVAQQRYGMLQIIREYAQTRLTEFYNPDHLAARHAAIYSALVADLQPKLRTAGAETALNQLEIEHNNLRDALAWRLRTDPEVGLSLAVHLSESLWSVRGYYDEGRGWLEKLLAAASSAEGLHSDRVASTANHAAAWLAVANMALGQGDLPAAARFAQRSEALAIAGAGEQAVRAALRCRASIALHQSNYAQAHALYQQALALCHVDKDRREATAILNGLGLVAKDQGDYAEALEYHERSYALAAAAGDMIGMARAVTYASIAAYWQGSFARCIELAQRSIQLQQGVGDVVSITYSREVQAIALVRQGRFDEGDALLKECAAIFAQMNDQSGLAVTLVDLGQAAFVQGNDVIALRCHSQALEISLTIGDRRRMAFCLEGLAVSTVRQALTLDRVTAQRQGSLMQAVTWLAAATTLRSAIGAPLPQIDRAPVEQSHAAARSTLPPARYHDAWQQGATVNIEDLCRQGVHSCLQGAPSEDAAVCRSIETGTPAALPSDQQYVMTPPSAG